MQFDLDLNFKKNINSKEQLIAAIGSFWQKIYKTILFVFLLCMIILSGYVWKNSLSGSVWSDQKKQEYLNSQNNSVVFNEKNFKKALLDIEQRGEFVMGDNGAGKDIFKSY